MTKKKNKTKQTTTIGLRFLVNDFLLKIKKIHIERKTRKKYDTDIRWGGGGSQYKHLNNESVQKCFVKEF